MGASFSSREGHSLRVAGRGLMHIFCKHARNAPSTFAARGSARGAIGQELAAAAEYSARNT